jgi:phosphatidylglycerophosphatase A
VGFPISTELKIEEFHGRDALREREHEHEHGESDFVAPVQLGTGRWSRWIAVAGGFGYVPIAPGTAGSFAGVLVFVLTVAVGTGLSLSAAGFLAFYGFSVGLLLLIGIRAAGRAEIDFGRRDDGRIVIDEVVGQLVSLMPLAFFLAPGMPAWTLFGSQASLAGEDLFLIILEVVTGFVLFRLFDVWKPGAVRWAERRFEGGLGVMADDLVAGLYAALGLAILHFLVFERFFSSSASLSSVASVVSVASVGISA